MNRAESILKERNDLANLYEISFRDLEWLRTPKLKSGYSHGFQSYACLFKPKEVEISLLEKDFSRLKEINIQRNKWMEYLQSKGISSRPATHAVHMLSYYREKYNLKPEDFPNAFAANDCSISLPLFHGMKFEENKIM